VRRFVVQYYQYAQRKQRNRRRKPGRNVDAARRLVVA
jgi:hypothetical protein